MKLYTVSRCVPAWLLLMLVVLGAGCGSSSSSSGGSDSTVGSGITSGTIGGLAFTVTAGTVTQETDDGPITAGATESTILFDSDLDTLSGATDDALFRISVVVSDGGSVDALGFGTTGDSFANALMATMDRSGDDFTWAVYWGAGASSEADGTFPRVTDAGATVRLLAAFDNFLDPARITLWRPDESGTGSLICNDHYSDNVGGTVDQGNGQRAAIRFRNATISDVIIDDDYSFLCV